MICEKCGSEHDGKYGSGRFCCEKCARSFSTATKREEINKKVSKTLTGKKFTSERLKNVAAANKKRAQKLTDEQRQKYSISFKTLYESFSEEKKTSILNKRKKALRRYHLNRINSILDLSKRTVVKIFKRMGIGCSICGWNKTVCDIHHINGQKCENANSHYNLTYVCPNCHRLIHNGLIPKEKIINLIDYIGDAWKEFYYG